MRRLTPAGWFALVVLVMLVASILVLASCATKPEAAPPPAETAQTLPPESIGATVRDVGAALHLWDDFIFSSKHPSCGPTITANCVTVAERDRVMEAFQRYVKTNKGPRSTTDPTPAPRDMAVAARDFVVAVADVIERWK